MKTIAHFFTFKQYYFRLLNDFLKISNKNSEKFLLKNLLAVMYSTIHETLLKRIKVDMFVVAYRLDHFFLFSNFF